MMMGRLPCFTFKDEFLYSHDHRRYYCKAKKQLLEINIRGCNGIFNGIQLEENRFQIEKNHKGRYENTKTKLPNHHEVPSAIEIAIEVLKLLTKPRIKTCFNSAEPN